VAKDSKMLHEIRTLDSDMQMLVYENYAKFISATETIRRMKGNVEGMQGDMERVKEQMDSISSKSTDLNDALAPKWQSVTQLVRLKVARIIG